MFILLEYRGENNYNVGVYSSKKKATEAAKTRGKISNGGEICSLNNVFFMQRVKKNSPAKTTYTIPVKF